MIVTECQARHGLSAADYQSQFDVLGSQGYRLVKVSGYCENNHARFAGIWYKRGGNRWQARHGISPDAYQQAITDLERQEYSPIHVSVLRLEINSSSQPSGNSRRDCRGSLGMASP